MGRAVHLTTEGLYYKNYSNRGDNPANVVEIRPYG
jgi:hypothetical protein